ncbi:MAG: hypothetical protein JWM83_935 [Candidatus Angelobacter sp.]|nr:hypothetical protein [Candidatus Angelobacter sp.]
MATRTFCLFLLACWIPACFAQSLNSNSREVALSTSIAREKGFELIATEPIPTVGFAARGADYTVRLAPGEIQLRFEHGTKSVMVPEIVRVSFAGGKPAASPQLSDPFPGVTHYYVGTDPSQWRTDVRKFRQVGYHDLYPGIDLLFYSHSGQLEFDFNVAPRHKVSDIDLHFEGATVRESEGNLQIVTPGGNVAILKRPELYQVREGRRQIVRGNYLLRNSHEAGFTAGPYDKHLPLIIDPALIYSTLVQNILGTASVNGQEIDFSTAIAVDSTGAAYITGVANDTAFVQKFNATGTAMVYQTFMGSSFSHSDAITVDTAGNAYMVGTAQGSLLPVTAGAFSTVSACEFNAAKFGSCEEPFVVKLDATGKIVFCTYLVKDNVVDSAGPRPGSIAVDASGALYIAGGLDDPSSVNSVTPATMPGLTTTPGAFQIDKKSNANLFAMKLHPDGSTVDYATYIGGSGVDQFGGMVLDPTGVAYITGGSFSADFPTTTGAFQTQNPGNSAVFLKLKSDGSGLLYSTFLGAAGIHSRALSIGIDATNAAYLTGETDGPGFPTTSGAFKTSVNGPAPGPDSSGNVFNYTFASKFDPAGNLAFSTYVGDAVSLPKSRGAFNALFGRRSLAVDSSGIYLVGTTASPQYPTLNSIAAKFGHAMFLTKLNLTGSALIYSTFFGSDQAPSEIGPAGLVIDGSQNVYVTGFADAISPHLSGPPTTAGAFETTPQFFDGFPTSLIVIAKIATALGAPVPVPIPRAYDLDILMGRHQVPPPAPIQLSNFGDADLPLGAITITGPNAIDFTQTNNCGTVVPAGGECLISVGFSYQDSATNPRTASLNIGFAGAQPSQTVSLSAPGGAPNVQLFLGLNQITTLDFGPVAIGSQAATTLGLFDPGSAPAILQQILTTGDFSTPAVPPSILLPGGPVPSPVFIPFFQVPVTFKPSGSGTRTGQLIVLDAAFNSPHIVQLTGTAVSDFSLQPSTIPDVVTVSGGGTANYMLVLANAQGFSGSGTFTCSGLPAGTACSIAPASFSFSGSAGTQNISVAVTTTGSVVSTRPASSILWWGMPGVLGALLMVGSRRNIRSPKNRSTIVLMLSVMVCCASLTSCGGGKSSGGPVPGSPGQTPPGTFALTVTATSGNLSRSAPITLQVR